MTLSAIHKPALVVIAGILCCFHAVECSTASAQFQRRELPGNSGGDQTGSDFQSRDFQRRDLPGRNLLGQQGSPAAPQQSVNRIVRLEIIASSRASPTALQEWAEELSEVGASSVRVKSQSGLVEPGIEEHQFSDVVSITVTGLVNDRQIQLPGVMFNRGDTAQIAQYIQRLKDDGAAIAMAEKKAFGLTSEQLVTVSEELKTPVGFSTEGLTVGQVVQQIIGTLPTQFALDQTTQTALSGASIVPEQLQGMSAGTALAAAIRPLGLALAPHREQGEPVKFRIIDSLSASEHWPVGWPIEESLNIAEPRMAERIPTIEIRNVPLSGTLDALEQRIGVPFLYDHNGMAAAGVDLSAVQVTLVDDDIAHVTALTKLLRQSDPQMQLEVRMDENGKTFVWISTLR